MKLFLLGEGPTEWTVIPILFRRCAKLNEDQLEIETIRKRRQAGISLVKNNLVSTYRKNFSEKAVFLVGLDNDNKEPQHNESHFITPDKDCNFCSLQESINKVKEEISWAEIHLASIIFVPVQMIEAWLLFGAEIIKRPRENHPEKIPKDQVKSKFCGTMHVTLPIIAKFHKPVAEQINLEYLRENVISFDFFYRQVEQYMETLSK